MEHGGAPAGILREIDILQDIGHLQRRETLAIGRQLAQFIALAIGHAARVDPETAVRGKVRIAQIAANPPEIGIHGPGDFTFVEGIASPAGNHAQRIGEIRIFEHFPGLRRAIGEPGGPGVGELNDHLPPSFKGRQVALKIMGDHGCDRMAFAGIGYGGCQNVAHRHLSELAMQLKPAVDSARDRDRQGTERRDGGAVAELFAQFGIGGAHRTFSRGVEAMELLRLRIPDNREQIAANPVACRLHQAQRGIGSDRRIDRIAAFP